MEQFAMSIAETFEFMQPFCSVAMRKQSAFESTPMKQMGSGITLATTAEESEMSEQRQEASFAQVHYLKERCDTSLTSSLSEDEMLLPYDPSFPNPATTPPTRGPVPAQVTFFNPRKRETQLSRLSLQWHVKRAVGGFKGIDEWTGRLFEEADARQDTDGFLGQVTCFRISPKFQLPSSIEQKNDLRAVHPYVALLSEYMETNTTLPPMNTEKSLFGLPLVLVTHVQVAEEQRGMGLGLLLMDETCRCLANPAQWVILACQDQSLRDYFGLLGFAPSGLLDGEVIIRWNDPYCMATHRFENLCPHLPRVAVR
uniref:N-acetyltransferase domain-containing protein n=1 Tax=Amphora coffeiformis TaxID=265554 RepID=A0A7S3LGF1_9STRA|mmetsp:Transcript_13101/g.26614  ORF Transcript_13101/g.26614 Transcript_13101/m.26614 type:complete len:312 (+) Transcript_13101:134-1069(+)